MVCNQVDVAVVRTNDALALHLLPSRIKAKKKTQRSTIGRSWLLNNVSVFFLTSHHFNERVQSVFHLTTRHLVPQCGVEFTHIIFFFNFKAVTCYSDTQKERNKKIYNISNNNQRHQQQRPSSSASLSTRIFSDWILQCVFDSLLIWADHIHQHCP